MTRIAWPQPLLHTCFSRTAEFVPLPQVPGRAEGRRETRETQTSLPVLSLFPAVPTDLWAPEFFQLARPAEKPKTAVGWLDAWLQL